MLLHRYISLLTVAGVLLAAGCRPVVQERNYFAVSGVASAIDVETGMVSMDWKNRRNGKLEPMVGRVTQTTEIFINGISASLENVRPGDRGIVVVYRAYDPEEHWVVTSVSVERDESYMLNKPFKKGSGAF